MALSFESTIESERARVRYPRLNSKGNGSSALVIGRGIQGLGGGALMALPNTIVADILSPRERGRYQVYISGTYAVSSLAGPVLGGIISGQYSWRWIFWINLPLTVLAIALSWITLADLNTKRTDVRIDYIGSALLIVSTISLLLALTWGGHIFPWISSQEGILLGCFLIFLYAFLIRQFKFSQPLVPVSIITNRVIAITSIGALLITIVNTPISVFVPLYLQWIRGRSVESAGYLLTAPLFGVVLGSYLSGQYMRHTGKYKLPPLIGLTIAAAGLAFCAVKANDVGLYVFSFVMFLVGLGIGGSLPPMMVSSQNSVPSGDIGIATAVHTYFRAVGGAIGVVFFTAIVVGDLGVSANSIVLSTGTSSNLGGLHDYYLNYAFVLFFGISSVITHPLARAGFR